MSRSRLSTAQSVHDHAKARGQSHRRTAPPIVKRYVRWLFGKDSGSRSPNRKSCSRQKLNKQDPSEQSFGSYPKAVSETAYRRSPAEPTLDRFEFSKQKAQQQAQQQARTQRRKQRLALKTSSKALFATGSVATLALLAVVPNQVASQSVRSDSCQEVVQSGAEISRGELASLVSIPQGATREAVRELIDVPYCLLPAAPDSVWGKASRRVSADTEADDAAAAPIADKLVTTREAYPLAFDPEAWVVVDYSESGYVGYDFVFKR